MIADDLGPAFTSSFANHRFSEYGKRLTATAIKKMCYEDARLVRYFVIAKRIANGFAKSGVFAKEIWTFAKFCLALRVATWITSAERQAKPTLLN